MSCYDKVHVKGVLMSRVVQTEPSSEGQSWYREQTPSSMKRGGKQLVDPGSLSLGSLLLFRVASC